MQVLQVNANKSEAVHDAAYVEAAAENDEDETGINSPEGLIRCCRSAQNASAIRKGAAVRKAPYWWNDSIQMAREACNACRRGLLRSTRRGDEEEALARREEHRRLRKEFRKRIRAAKREQWRLLCQSLEDIWGDGYGIATKHLTDPPPPPAFNLDTEAKLETVRLLFPERRESWQEEEPVDPPAPFH